MGEYSLADEVLFIGHSLIGTEIPRMLADVVQSRGGEGKETYQVINGAPLVWNWEHSAEAEGLPRVLHGEWGDPFHAASPKLAAQLTAMPPFSSGRPATEEPSAMS